MKQWMSELELMIQWNNGSMIRESMTPWLTKERMNERTNERMNDWMTDRLTDWLTDWQADWLTDWLTDRMNERANEWMNECMNEWMNERNRKKRESMNQWMSEVVSLWINESVNQWIDDSVNPWCCCESMKTKESINESAKQWSNESMDQWISEWWMSELFLVTSSLTDLFAEAPLLSATSSLSTLLSGLLLLWPCSEVPPSLFILFCSFCNPCLLFAQLLQCV